MSDQDRKDFLIALGINIKRLREEKGLSQDDLARMCGYTSDNSRSTINKIEAGKNDIPASKLKKIADALNTTPAALMKSSSQVQQEMKVCELFEQCYGKEAFRTVSAFLKLDATDRQNITGMISVMLNNEKYSAQEGLKHA